MFFFNSGRGLWQGGPCVWSANTQTVLVGCWLLVREKKWQHLAAVGTIVWQPLSSLKVVKGRKWFCCLRLKCASYQRLQRAVFWGMERTGQPFSPKVFSIPQQSALLQWLHTSIVNHAHLVWSKCERIRWHSEERFVFVDSLLDRGALAHGSASSSTFSFELLFRSS